MRFNTEKAPEPGPGGMNRRSFLKFAALGGGLSMLSLVSALGLRSAGTETLSYSESAELFPNPERGWFVTIDPLQTTYDDGNVYVRGNTTMPQNPPPGFEDYALTVEKLREHRANGVSLIRKYYLLYDYRSQEISEDYLDRHPRADFELMREEGFKIIPRFVYTWNIQDYEATDAPASRILSHLDQLAPIFEENADVISHLEIGLVGHYGEWHYYSEDGSDVYDHLTPSLSLNWPGPLGLGPVPATYPTGLGDSSRAIIDKVFEVLPSDRMATLRYLPHVKQMHDEVYGGPLTASQAYGGEDKSRLGLMDDSFLYDVSHRGGYSRPEEAGGLARDAERAFQRETSRYVVMSGEPSGTNVGQSDYLENNDPIAELEEMHWNCMNNGQYESVRDGVYDYWRSQGLYDEIGARLGYRLSLKEASAPSRVSPGSTLRVTMNIENTGFAAPHNERPVWLILENVSTGAVYSVRTEVDARDWEAGTSTEAVLKGRIPPKMPAGSYEVSLSLPDPAPSLSPRPEYAIRLASEAGGSSIWNPSTGHNELRLRTRVSPLSSSASAQTSPKPMAGSGTIASFRSSGPITQPASES
ncbi:MAG: DUF4832 domain-containing protein [Rubrobacter sp.]